MYNRKKVPYESKSLKSGFFTKEELTLYELSEDEIDIILRYQEDLPILQESEDVKVNARDLHQQLKVKQHYTTWIKSRIESYSLIQDVDYFTKSQKCEIVDSRGFRTIIDYFLTIDCAKQLSMVERTELGALARRYFIIIEKAFKNRYSWNSNRKNTLINCIELRHAIICRGAELREGLPEWMNKPRTLYSIEFSLLNSIILGMSASQYQKTYNTPNKNIRNYFSEDQLNDVERLERYDAQLILSQSIYDYDERKKILQAEYDLRRNRKREYI